MLILHQIRCAFLVLLLDYSNYEYLYVDERFVLFANGVLLTVAVMLSRAPARLRLVLLNSNVFRPFVVDDRLE
jgi:hypothetical protein